MQKSDLTELEIETQDLKLRLGRPGSGTTVNPIIPQPIPIAAPSPHAPEQSKNKDTESPDYSIFKSPMVGTFYRKPSPEDAYFVQIGDIVKKGDVLCIIEAMKVMNEVQSDVSGEVMEILLEDGNSVEYGQPLFKIRKN
ncbi:MAG: acetyl-CoA carboxylase, biotin carboxyl carrier protein [Opitutae bacterium]|nr:acetyl-CoA carboxylase, biotin carboxyl carrier protein [Opitutae bacterium]